MSALSENLPLLNDLVAGRLPKTEMMRLLEQLVEDDEAMAVVDALWGQQPGHSAAFQLPDLSSDVARSLERRLFNGLQRSELAGRTVRLGTEGFFGVLLAMLRPLLMAGSGKKETSDE